MPHGIVIEAEQTCDRVLALVEQRAEPFGDVGRT
jgi:hypothetical protein